MMAWEWTAITLNFAVNILLLFALLFAFYRIDSVHTGLQRQVSEIQYKFTKLVNAINTVNYSDYQLDVEQQRQLESLGAKIPTNTISTESI